MIRGPFEKEVPAELFSFRFLAGFAFWGSTLTFGGLGYFPLPDGGRAIGKPLSFPGSARFCYWRSGAGVEKHIQGLF